MAMTFPHVFLPNSWDRHYFVIVRDSGCFTHSEFRELGVQKKGKATTRTKGAILAEQDPKESQLM